VPLPTQAFGWSVDVHAPLTGVSGTGGEGASGGGKATRLLSDARHSLAKAAFQAGRTVIVGKLNEPCSRYIAAPSMKIIIHAVAPTVPAFLVMTVRI
jgi:hypothetical protein